MISWFKKKNLAESHLFLFVFCLNFSGQSGNSLFKLVMLVTRTADNLLHHSFVVNDASFGTFAISQAIVYDLPMYRFSSTNLLFVSTNCRSDFMHQKKS